MLNKRSIKKGIAIFILFAVLIFFIALFNSFSKLSYNGDHSNSFFTELKNHHIYKAIVFIPHADDEIYVAGSLLYGLNKANIKTYVVYFTNSNSFGYGGKRKLEAINSCKELGVSNENIFFLDFPERKQSDTSDITGTSSLNDRHKIKETIKSIILKLSPQLIVCSDFDFHRDHRLYSILFDESIGELKKEKKFSNCIIWKGFAYETSYNAPNDFYNINLLSTKKPTDQQNKKYDTDVPFYEWDARIRIPVHNDILTHSIFFNPLYKASSKHWTTIVYLKALNAINSDQVFWNRRIDNLAFSAKFEVSSGDPKHLNDFKLFDVQDITINKRYNVEYYNCVWIPSIADKQKKITIKFPQPINIYSIVLYDNPDLNNNILSGELELDDGSYINLSNFKKNGAPSEFQVNKMGISSLSFKIVDFEGKTPGLSEFEIFSQKMSHPRILKLIDQNTDAFIYKYFVTNNAQIPLSVYLYPKYFTDYSITVEDSLKSHASIKNNHFIMKNKFRKCNIIVRSKNNPELYDKVEFIKLNKFDIFIYNLFSEIDFKCVIFVDKFNRNNIIRAIKEKRFFTAIKTKLNKITNHNIYEK